MKNGFLILMVFILIGSIFISCNVGNRNGTGTLILKLTDTPILLDGKTVEAINVTIGEVKVSRGGEDLEDLQEGAKSAEYDPGAESDGGWIIISDEIQPFDLMNLRDGATVVLGEVELEEGRYNQIRLIVDENNTIKFEGDETLYDLKIPSGTKTGVKLVGGFTIVADKETEITLDFDAEESVSEKGLEGYYFLKPTIKVHKTKESE